MKISRILKKATYAITKPGLVQKKIIGINRNKKGAIIVSFSDGTRARFFNRYSSKLLKNNIVEFLAYSKGNWLNPAKDPKLKVIKQKVTILAILEANQ